MRAIIFDTGPIISLTLNNLLWVLKDLKKKSGLSFYLTEGVRKELIDKPLGIKRFEFEAIQVMKEIREGTLQVLETKELRKETEKIMNKINTAFEARKEKIKIIQYAEVEALIAAKKLEAEAVAVDERTARTLIETPHAYKKILEHRLRRKVKVDKQKLTEIKKIFKEIKFIRSTEIAAIAYEEKLLDDYVERGLREPRKKLLEAVLWGLKLNGCSISKKEINQLIKYETGKQK